MHHLCYKTFGTTVEHGKRPWSRDGAGAVVPTWRAQTSFPTKRICTAHLCTTSSRPTGEQSQQSCIFYFLNSYFRKFNTKWQMNANYTSIAQLKLEMLSTGSCSNPSHSSCAYVSKELSPVPRGWQKAQRQTALPGAIPHVLVCARAHTRAHCAFQCLRVGLGEQHHNLL